MSPRGKSARFTPRKSPIQARSRETFDAIVDACTGLLPRLGYAGTTTNHIAARAGVSIASLYEYFPGKDAVVAQVAERMVERVLKRLQGGVSRVFEAGENEAVRLWIGIIYETVEREKGLVSVFTGQVPFTSELAPFRDLGPRLLQFSREAQARAGPFVRDDFSPAALHLLVNLVSSSILQLVHAPPRDVSREALLDELARRVEDWIRGSRPSLDRV